MTCVWIAFEPQVFREALIQSLGMIGYIEVVESASDRVEIGIFRLSDTGELQDFFLHKSLPLAKMIVFSPKGDQAYVRLPGGTNWKVIRPFGMSQLIGEVLAGPNRYSLEITMGGLDV
jgi:hypothetical protein